MNSRPTARSEIWRSFSISHAGSEMTLGRVMGFRRYVAASSLLVVLVAGAVALVALALTPVDDLHHHNIGSLPSTRQNVGRMVPLRPCTRVGTGLIASQKPAAFRCWCSGNSAGDSGEKIEGEKAEEAETSSRKSPGVGKVNFYDPVATASRFITRRVGFKGALGFIALLAGVEGYEIGKAALEDLTKKEASGVPISTASGLTYTDIKVGGGKGPTKGDFVGVQMTVSVDGRPIAFVFGKRPFQGLQCEGLEEGVVSMKRGGVRKLIIPPELAFGEEGVSLPGGERVPSGATVEMVVEIQEISPAYYGQ